VEIALMFGIFLVLFTVRVPIGIALGAASMVGYLIAPVPFSPSALATAMWQGVNSSLLLAVPFFLLLGNLALASGLTEAIVKWAGTFVGHLRGGLAQINILVSMVMAGMSGSDLSDAAASGSILIPAMKREGYPAGYAAAITEGSASVGPLIPPSITLILVGSVTGTSVGRLFLAGAVPGFILGGLLVVLAYYTARKHGFPRSEKVEWSERIRMTIRILPVLLLPLVVLGVIVFGFTTVTEAAVIGVVAVALLGFLYFRELTLADTADQLYHSVRITASIFFLLAMASMFARVLALYGAPALLADFISTATENPLIFLLGLMLVYLLLGMFLEPVPVILIFVPLVAPAANALGVDPLHFGVVTVFTLVIGLMTPPFGLGMFLVCRIAGIEMGEYLRWAWPIILITMVGVLIVIFVPATVLTIPNLLLPL
jgi:C4-dicarboxylate transporter, DctM subunit